MNTVQKFTQCFIKNCITIQMIKYDQKYHIIKLNSFNYDERTILKLTTLLQHRKLCHALPPNSACFVQESKFVATPTVVKLKLQIHSLKTVVQVGQVPDALQHTCILHTSCCPSVYCTVYYILPSNVSSRDKMSYPK